MAIFFNHLPGNAAERHDITRPCQTTFLAFQRHANISLDMLHEKLSMNDAPAFRA